MKINTYATVERAVHTSIEDGLTIAFNQNLTTKDALAALLSKHVMSDLSDVITFDEHELQLTNAQQP